MSKEKVYRCDICWEITDIKGLFGITFYHERPELRNSIAEMASKHICGPCVRALRKDFDQLWVAKRLSEIEAWEAANESVN